MKHVMTVPLTVLLAIILVSDPAAAGSPESTLKMCLRDVKNMSGRAQKSLDKAAQQTDLRSKHRPIGSAETDLERFEKSCINGPKADQIRDLPGYAEVLAKHKEFKTAVTTAVKELWDAHRAENQAFLDAGPGGDAKTIKGRWRVRPDECYGSGWELDAKYNGQNGFPPQDHPKHKGKAPTGGKKKSAARIKGLDALDDEPGGEASRTGLGKILFDLRCGVKVEGVDPSFRERDGVKHGYIYADDRRAKLGIALLTGEGSDDERVLYQAALAHYCFAGTQWDPVKDYAPYLFCAEAVSGLDLGKLESALKRRYGDSKYPIDNYKFIAKRGLQAKAELDGVIEKVERKFPKMKQLLRDAPDRARKAFAERQRKYSEILEVVAPVTKQLMEDAEQAPPDDCEDFLLDARAILKKEIKLKTPDDVKTLMVFHPIGYQITEALAYCYLHNGKLAKARIEGEALKQANRRVTLVEELFYTSAQDREAMRKKLKSDKQYEKAIPGAGWGLQFLLGGREYAPPLASRAARKASFRTAGESEREPAIIVKKSKAKGGVKLTFKKHKFRYKDQKYNCKDTNKIDRYDMVSNSSGGVSVKPIYKQKCWKVGKPKMKTITYQEKPVVLPKDQADLVKKGMQVTVLANRSRAGDAVIMEAWVPKKGKSKDDCKMKAVSSIPIR